MIIRSAEFRNYCQHRHLTLEFSPHLNLIVGPNGSGKSNLLNGLLYLLTGTDRNEGRITDNIAYGRPRGQPTVLTGTFQHGDAVCEVYREIAGRNATHRVQIGRDQPVTGVTPVTETLLQLLGTSRQQVEDYVFVAQRKIDGWLDKQPKDRSNELGQLFGVDKSERIWHSLGAFIGRVEIPSVSTDIDQLRREVAAAEEAVRAQQQALEAYADVPDNYQQVLAQHQATIDAYTTYVAAKQATDQAAAALQNLTTEHIDAVAELSQAQQDADLIDAAVADSQQQFDDAMSDMAEWTAYDAAGAIRQGYLYGVQRAWERWATTPRQPTKPDYYDTVQSAEWQARYRDLDVRRVDIDSTLRQLHNVQPGDPCPTCGAAAESLDQHREGLEMRREQLVPLFTPMVEQAQACAQYDDGLRTWQTQREQLHIEVCRLKTLRTELRTLAAPETDKATLQQVIVEHQQLVSDLQAARAGVAASQRTVNDRQTRRAQAERQNCSALDHIATLRPVTQEARSDAIAARDALQQRVAEKAAVQGQLSSAEAVLHGQRTRLEDHESTQRRRQLVQAATGRLEAVRTIHHRTEAPRMVTFTYLEQMTTEINEVLTLFDAPYYVAPTDDLGFMATFGDGKEQTDKRLSVGERIVLAMAFRITVNSTFAGSLGMLSMDEPTAGLDSHNLGCLPRALDQLRELSQARGLQIFFVTHEPRIAHYFDNVIEIE